MSVIDPTRTRPLGWLSRWLNDGKVSGWKAGEKVEFTNSRGNPRIGEVLGAGPMQGEIAVQVGDVVYNVRKARPTSYARGSLKPAQRRDAAGRFTR